MQVGPFQLQLHPLKRPYKISRFTSSTLYSPSHINIANHVKSPSIQATMPQTRSRGSRRHGSTAPHPSANPADQFALAFGTDDVSNTHRGTDDTPESQNNEGDGSTSPTGNNDPNDDESDPISRRLAEYRANFNPESIRNVIYIRQASIQPRTIACVAIGQQARVPSRRVLAAAQRCRHTCGLPSPEPQPHSLPPPRREQVSGSTNA